MKKYIYFVTNQPHWLNVAKKLYQNNIAKPIMWLGDDVHFPEASKLFGDIVVKDLTHRHRNYDILKIDYSGEHIDFFSSENYLRAKDICLKMMDRIDLYGSFGRLDREVYFHKLLIWNLKKIYYSKPDVLITAEAPHDYPKYLVFEICKYLEIPCFKFSNWMPVPLIFLQNMQTDQIVEKENYTISNIDEDIDRDLKDFVNKIKLKDDKYELYYMKAQRVNSKLKNRILNFINKKSIENLKDIKHNLGMIINSVYNPINPFRLNFFMRTRNQRLRKKNLLKAINYSEEKIENKSKYVYFPLHYEPERTTNPDGGFFHDQFIVLTHLRKFIPNDIEIIVKEHPSQLYSNMNGSRGRSPLIYNLIKNIHGLRLAKTSHSSIKLIKNSEFIATITGSVAIEASVLGKKAITFGSTWYQGCPNIYEWKELLNYKQLVDFKIKSSNEIYSFFITHKNKHSIPGFINGSQRKFFNNYENEEFESVQNKEVYNLLVNLFNSNYNV